jgi:quinol monooxygenase YgiN
MYLLHGKLLATSGNRTHLADILLQAANLVGNAKGCKLYVISSEAIEENTVFITEIWESKEDHDQSLNYPGVRELIMEAMPMIEGKPEKGQELTLLGGFGI